jgi:DNA-binding HxlR family transcriptional regulator
MEEIDITKLMCPVKYTLQTLDGKWKLKVIWQLTGQEYIRFNELQRRLDGISTVVLKRTLNELEFDEIINREQYNEVPPKVEYSLTPLGHDLLPVFNAMAEWAEKNNVEQCKSIHRFI